MSNKFLNPGGSTNLSNGTANIYASELGAVSLDPSQPLKTNSVRQLVSSKLDINDINNLQSILNSTITVPYNGNLTATQVTATGGPITGQTIVGTNLAGFSGKNVILGDNVGTLVADNAGLFTTTKTNPATTSFNNTIVTATLGTGQNLSTGTDNILIGNNVGNALTIGKENILMGTNTGKLMNGNSNYNVAIGDNCLINATATNENVCVGNECGTTLITGEDNVMIGNKVEGGTTATKNIGVGYAIGAGLTTGSNNVFIGDGAGGNVLTTGYNNICVGSTSGSGLITGYSNKIIGSSSTTTGSSNKNIVIGDNNNFPTENCILIGDSIVAQNNNEIVIGGPNHTVMRSNTNQTVDLGSSTKNYKDAYVKGLTINNIGKYISDVSQFPAPVGDDITLEPNVDYTIVGDVAVSKNIVFNTNNSIKGLSVDASIDFGSGTAYGFRGVNQNIYVSNLTIKGGGLAVTGTNYINQYNPTGQEKLVCGVRKIIPNYPFTCLVVRRASDNALLDIGFVGNRLDVSALETFINGTTGFVELFYNQANTTSHTVGFTSSGLTNNQPQILVKTISGVKVPYVRFVNQTGNDCCMTTLNTTYGYGITSPTNQNPCQISIGFSGTSFNGTIEFFTSSSPSEGSFEIHNISSDTIRLAQGGNVGAVNIATWGPSASGGEAPLSGTFNDGVYHLIQAKYYGTQSSGGQANLTFDGVVQGTLLSKNDNTDLQVDCLLKLGCRGAGAFQYNDEFYEIVYYNQVQQSTDDTKFYNDSVNYFKNPVSPVSSGGLFDCRSIDYNGSAPFYGRTNRFKLNDCNILGPIDLGIIDGFGTINIYSNFINGLQTVTTGGFKCSNGLSLQYSNNKSVLFKGTTASNSGVHLLLKSNTAWNPNGAVMGFNAMLINNNIIHPRSTEVAIELEAGSTTKLGSIVGNTLINEVSNILIKYPDSVAFPNYNAKEIRNYIVDSNSGIENSTVGGNAYFSGETVSTQTTTLNAFVLVRPTETTISAINKNNKVGCFMRVGGTPNIAGLVLGDKIRGTTSNTEAVVCNIYPGVTNYFGMIDLTGNFTNSEPVIRISDSQALGNFVDRQFYVIYAEKDPRKVIVTANLQIEGDNNIIYEIALFKNEVLIPESIIGVNASGPNRPVGINTTAFVSLMANDYIDVRIRNTETTATVIVRSGLLTLT